MPCDLSLQSTGQHRSDPLTGGCTGYPEVQIRIGSLSDCRRKSIKRTLAKIYGEIGVDPSPSSVAFHYDVFLNCIYLDNQDKDFGKEIQNQV
jgi:hypothetical protein